ncbi:MAG: pilin major subunit VirB2 [Acidocella sp.]|nr:pilin major subunit VirB2 [Acidocella sp.]
MMDMIAPLLLAQVQRLRTTRLWPVAARAWPLALQAAILGVPALADAQTVSGGASPQTMINNVCTFILGPFGETIAVLGIIGIGFLFMFGRASLGVIAGIIGGIVIMFGASYLGQTLTGGG